MYNGATLSTEKGVSSWLPMTNPVLTTVLTAMASQGDIEIEVTDPEKYPNWEIHCHPGIIDLYGGRQRIFDS